MEDLETPMPSKGDLDELKKLITERREPEKPERRLANFDEKFLMILAQEFVHGSGSFNGDLARQIMDDLGFSNEAYFLPDSDLLSCVLSKQVLWIAENDKRTCKFCDGCSERIFVLESLPKYHPNCRCGLNLPEEELRDVTDEVMSALREFTKISVRHPLDVPWLISQVDDGKPWDIKNEGPWNQSIKTEYPGSYFAPVMFYGEQSSPEWLGNFTFGYITGIMLFGRFLAILGSIGKAVWNLLIRFIKDKDNSPLSLNYFLDKIEEEYVNEVGDHPAINKGYDRFKKDLNAGYINDLL
ncbi:hypothetical protein, partial [Treponema sp. R6D11]